MKTRLSILLGIAVLLVMVGQVAADADTAVATNVDPAVAAAAPAEAPTAAPAADPFLGMSDVTTSAGGGGGGTFCPCSPGYNCCGDGLKRGCGPGWTCRCVQGNCTL